MMSFKKYIEATVTIQDPISINAGGDDGNLLLRKLQYMFVGKCNYGCKILRILPDSFSAGPIVIDYVGLTSGNVKVKFLAECIVRQPGDILVGCRINSTTGGVLIGTHGQDDVIAIQGDQRAASIKIGDMIIVSVIRAVHSIESQLIRVEGELYSHPRFNIVYGVEGDFCPNDQSSLLMQHIETLREEIKAQDKESVEFFQALFYPWRDKKPDPPGSKRLSIAAIVSGKCDKVPRYLCFDSRLGFSSDVIFGYEEALFPADYLDVEVKDATVVIEQILVRQISHLTAIRDAANIYTSKLRKEYSMMWRLIDSTRV